ncbi:MAG: hypothetical protein COB26_07190 [Piscirickettsiaceae bacterium]|nr:MAG: hypothetical protein COB26_07190 [Piscirickettsiaceae bacterium]
MLGSTQDRFKKAVDPEGTPWEPLLSKPVKNKKKSPDKMFF